MVVPLPTAEAARPADGGEAPSAWVARFAPLIPAGEALDLACGRGRHARLLAERSLRVLAVDRDLQALAELAASGASGIVTLQLDLETGAAWPFDERRFSGIVVTNYLHRPLLPHLLASLASGGVLIYETFAAGNQRFGKPSNPDFLLQPGELLALAQAQPAGSLRVLAYEDGYMENPRPAMVQRICVLRTAAETAPGLF